MTTSPFDTRPTQQSAQAAAPTSTPAPEPGSFDLQIEADEPAYVTVNLVGKRYRVKAPKAALGLKLAVRAKQAEESPDLMAEAIDERSEERRVGKEGRAQWEDAHAQQK